MLGEPDMAGRQCTRRFGRLAATTALPHPGSRHPSEAVVAARFKAIGERRANGEGLTFAHRNFGGGNGGRGRD